MATDIKTRLIMEQSRKRQRLNHPPKLLPTQQVEVRSFKEGFRGSWHRATVIERRTQIRVVKYHHLLRDNSSDNLVQFVPVSFAVDGVIPTNWQPSKFPNYRCKIRPIPPTIFENGIHLHFGQCVDVFVKDAWWEGVVFDHNDDDSDKRLVFFPDSGYESRVLLKNLRVTRDWDATTDEWRVRGDWVFLEVFEGFKGDLPVFVSVKRIWHELRMTKCFVYEMKEWTCPVKENWKEAIMDVMVDKFKLLVAGFFLGRSYDLDIKNKHFRDGVLRNEKEVVKKDESLRTTRVKRSSKRARKDVSPKYRAPRTVLTWLIDNDIVLPRAKVQYCCKKDMTIVKEGRVTSDGINCNCCRRVFSLAKFQKHAGRNNCGLPSGNIFLQDGRSLLDCQLQIKLDQSSRLKNKECEDEDEDSDDHICSVCQYGGELVLCDQCPSTFHTSCVGLKEVPDGEWFCPLCRCGICNENKFTENYEENVETNILNCEQCERRYHIGCLKRNKDFLKVKKSHPLANGFCSLRCEEIFTGLQQLLGKSIPVGKDNLTWTLRTNKTYECSNGNTPDTEDSVENHSKLNVAISVMHECFEPVKESRTGGDIVEDVILCRLSKLRRLNFRGFYTILLEKDDELISTGVVRVYGEKVAEVPLVGTRFQYRRRGMCHILMQELERKLKELGVERLVLPAVSNLLPTWTRSFGFSEMTESEKFKYTGYAFLDFQGTTMCHKLLSSTKPSTSKGNSCRKSADIDRINDVLEESQASRINDVLEESQASNPIKGENSIKTGFLKRYHRRQLRAC